MFERKSLTWQVGFARDGQSSPDQMVPAEVPGAVQLDWARAQGLGDHNVGDNHREYLWMEDAWWLYRAELPAKPEDGRRLFFVSLGIDYRFEVRIGRRVLLEQEGMFTPVELDVTDYAEPGAVLEVLVYPAPKSVPEPANRDQANQSVKPAVNYGWDFCPRLIPLGIWDATCIELRPPAHLRDAEVFYELAEDLSRAELTVRVGPSSACQGRVRWRLLDAQGAVAASAEADIASDALNLHATLDAPALWWPNGQGEPVLYRSVTELLDAGGAVVQGIESRVGFRRVRLVVNEGAWAEPARFPKTRSTPPITLEVNGRRIFGKGSNWVGPDIFPGTLTPDRYRALLQPARDAHMNLLRCWGGSNVQKQAFFDLCDEMGLMVWQEFPLSCNNHRDTPAYLRVLDAESRSIIRRLRAHPSVVLWCGGNELFNEWSGMTDQSLALRTLNRNCLELDPFTPFLPTSPLYGMAHGSYSFRDRATGREAFQVFHDARHTAYTEFGCDGPPPVDTLRRVLPAEDLPPRPTDRPYLTERATRGIGPRGRLWGNTFLKEYFPEPQSVEELVERGQFMQGVALKAIFEETRRQWPYCSMALNWCYSEPWPAISNMALLSWPAEPKAGYFQVAQALRPTLASARIEKFTWKAGELFTPELWLLNDAPEPAAPGTIRAVLCIGEREFELLRWDHPAGPANGNVMGPVIRFPLPDVPGAEGMVLELRNENAPQRDSRYTLLYRPTPS